MKLLIFAVSSQAAISDPFSHKISFQGPNTGPCQLSKVNETWISESQHDYGHEERCHQVLECPSGTLASFRFVEELHTDYYAAGNDEDNPYAEVGRPDGGCVHDYLIVSTRDQSKAGKKKNSEVFCGHSNVDLDPEIFDWMKTYSEIVVLDWWTDNTEVNSFGFKYGYKAEIKCTGGCPRDICLDKYFETAEWRKYEECSKWQLRYLKSMENKQKRREKRLQGRKRRSPTEFSPCPEKYRECDATAMRSGAFKKCLKVNKKTMKKTWKAKARLESDELIAQRLSPEELIEVQTETTFSNLTEEIMKLSKHCPHIVQL